MGNRSITANVMIDAKIFRKFTIFDYIYRQRRWTAPLAGLAIMLVSSAICFSMQGTREQASLLGWVLLVIGIGLPAIHVWSFFNSIQAQIKAYKLDTPKPVYSLQFTNETDGIRVTNPGGESAQYKWKSLYGVYRVTGCTYLYVIKNKAFLLPDEYIAEGAEALWSLFRNKLPAEKLHNRRWIKE